MRTESDPSESLCLVNAAGGAGRRLIDAMRKAKHVLVLTGAGASAESGIPTFRDQQVGLWENFDASELATPDAYQRDPALCWGWYEWRRAAVLRATPNAGHGAIAHMARYVERFTLVTQNVDDLHERAGSASVIHLHGELAKPYCENCGQLYTLPEEIPAVPDGGSRIEPPTCLGCGGRVRPGVVWFGENLPELEWYAARAAASECDLFFSVGTSSLVQPAASLVDLAAAAGAVTVEVNPNPTDCNTSLAYQLRGPAGEILPHLIRQAWPLCDAT